MVSSEELGIAKSNVEKGLSDLLESFKQLPIDDLIDTADKAKRNYDTWGMVHFVEEQLRPEWVALQRSLPAKIQQVRSDMNLLLHLTRK